MPRQRFPQELIRQVGDGSAFGSFTTAKSILLPAAVQYIPGNLFERVGDAIRVRASGDITTLVTTPGTVALQLMFGAVIVYTTGNIQMDTSGHTAVPWSLDIELEAATVGTGVLATLKTGVCNLTGPFQTGAGAAAGVSGSILPVPATSTIGTGFDSTIAQQVDFFGAFSISNAANIWKVRTFSLISLN